MYKNCPIKSYNLFKNEQKYAQDRGTGLGSVVLDQDKGMIYVKKSKASGGFFSVYLYAETVGGIESFFEVKINLVKLLNLAPIISVDD